MKQIYIFLFHISCETAFLSENKIPIKYWNVEYFRIKTVLKIHFKPFKVLS